jgi:hypothetical protein
MYKKAHRSVVFWGFVLIATVIAVAVEDIIHVRVSPPPIHWVLTVLMASVMIRFFRAVWKRTDAREEDEKRYRSWRYRDEED